MFARLGIADEMKDKARKIPATPVGEIVAHGDAEIGFQQISELKPVAGIDIVGPLPDDLQKITIFSAGIASASKEPDAGKALIKFLASPGGPRRNRQERHGADFLRRHPLARHRACWIASRARPALGRYRAWVRIGVSFRPLLS